MCSKSLCSCAAAAMLVLAVGVAAEALELELEWVAASGLVMLCGEIGTIACSGVTVGAWLALAVEPGLAIALPPGRMLPEKAARSDSCRLTTLEMLTEEIENSTMKSAISSVIMSA